MSDDPQYLAKLPDMPISGIDDAMKACADTIRRVRTGEIGDLDQAQAVFKGLQTYGVLWAHRAKMSPPEQANKEAARALARKAVAAMTDEQARDLLLKKNFQTFESNMGIINVEAKVLDDTNKANQLIKDASANDRESTDVIKRRSKADLF